MIKARSSTENMKISEHSGPTTSSLERKCNGNRAIDSPGRFFRHLVVHSMREAPSYGEVSLQKRQIQVRPWWVWLTGDGLMQKIA